MAVSFRILPRRGLVYVRYAGRMTIDASTEALAAYLADPDHARGQKQLIDLAKVTDWENDFARLLALQATKADAFFSPAAPTLMVAHAPTPVSQTVADFISRSWDGIDGVLYLVGQTEADTLDLLGLPERRISDILTPA